VALLDNESIVLWTAGHCETLRAHSRMMGMHTNVLVLAGQTIESDALLAMMVEEAGLRPTRFTLLVVGGAQLPLERVRGAVARQREAGLEVEVVNGDRDPMLAVQDVWSPGAYDAIIVSTLPDQTSRWLSSGLPFRVQRMTGALVRHVADVDDVGKIKDRAVDAEAVRASTVSSLRRRRALTGA
jgi:hypothetical protein